MNPQSAAPLITVITPCLNSVSYVAESIESVVEQRYPSVEHIVADGGSTDGTLEILSRFPHLKILPGPDGGVYSALNKALTAARGEIIGILNADDCYAAGALLTAGEYFAQHDVMALAGDAVSFRGASKAAHDEVARFTGAGEDLLYHAALGNPSMNAWFFRAGVFGQIGFFDASYRVAGDREFMLRLACSGLRSAQISQLLYRYRIHPGSMTFGGNQEIWDLIGREHNKMTDDYLRKPDLPRRARELLKQSRARDTLRLAIRSSRRRDLRAFIFYLRAGTRHDPLWPLRFAKRAIRRLIRYP
jgi:glycosyltransferase involved in cell wall biosynthesis